MKIKDFDFYKDLIRKKSGLYLPSSNAYLLSSRLTQVAKNRGFNNFDEMTVELRGFPQEDLLNDVIGAMTNNQTSFFRDVDFFEALKKEIIPDILKNKNNGRKFNIWCAGCATGQEPYSLAVLFQEEPLKSIFAPCKIKIHATDISKSVLQKAETGEFSQLDVQNGLPIKFMMAHFEQKEESWKAKDYLKKMIAFSHHNLLEPMDILEKFDLILCRYVLNDFDYVYKAEVLDNLADKVEPYGYLVFSKNEEAEKLSQNYEEVEGIPGVYKPASK